MSHLSVGAEGLVVPANVSPSEVVEAARHSLLEHYVRIDIDSPDFDSFARSHPQTDLEATMAAIRHIPASRQNAA